MPLVGDLEQPGLSETAPVNAPRRWPNSSESSRLSLKAEQFVTMNLRSRRGEALVDRARDQLLAGAVLALDQHGRRRTARSDRAGRRAPASRARRRRCRGSSCGRPARRGSGALRLAVALGHLGHQLERGLAEHRLDQGEVDRGELGGRQLRRGGGEPGARGVLHRQRGERGGLGRPPLDEDQLEAASAQSAARVAQGAQIEARPPRRSRCRPHCRPSVTSRHRGYKRATLLPAIVGSISRSVRREIATAADDFRRAAIQIAATGAAWLPQRPATASPLRRPAPDAGRPAPDAAAPTLRLPAAVRATARACSLTTARLQHLGYADSQACH